MTERGDEVPIFSKGELVLCYEPDPSRIKVLYDSKVLGVYERKDARGLRYYDYKIHFQGWNKSWDSAVRAEQLLKINEENRKLQHELEEAKQLKIKGGYSYKNTKTPAPPPDKKKRLTKHSIANIRESSKELLEIRPVNDKRGHQSLQQQHQAASYQHELQKSQAPSTSGSGAAQRGRNNSSGRKSGQNAQGDVTMKNTSKGTWRTPPNESDDEDFMDPKKLIHQEERVILRISERLREYMEYDYNMVVILGKQHSLPARVPIVTILENFVKQRAVDLVISIKQDSSRARNTQTRNARMEREFDRIMSKVCLLKEIVDGLRIYFEFLIEGHLLYKEEKEHVFNYLTEENMKHCCELLNESYEYIHQQNESDLMALDGTPISSGDPNSTNGDGVSGSILGNIEFEKQLKQYIGKRSIPPVPPKMRGFLCETFNWRILIAEAPPEKSMIFGAPHLARLLIKLPEYLNVSPIANEKLEELLEHLDLFINYLENHKEWFDKENYINQEQLHKDLLKSFHLRPTAEKVFVGKKSSH